MLLDISNNRSKTTEGNFFTFCSISCTYVKNKEFVSLMLKKYWKCYFLFMFFGTHKSLHGHKGCWHLVITKLRTASDARNSHWTCSQPSKKMYESYANSGRGVIPLFRKPAACTNTKVVRNDTKQSQNCTLSFSLFSRGIQTWCHLKAK